MSSLLINEHCDCDCDWGEGLGSRFQVAQTDMSVYNSLTVLLSEGCLKFANN